jgi:hypothetical protein
VTRREIKRLVGPIVLLAVVAVIAGGCGSSSSSSSSSGSSSGSTTGTVHFAKTKFALHAGLAFGAFHRYIYKPYKAGTFSHGLFSHKKALIKAALAALFVYHELKLAEKDAKASPLLRKLLTPLFALQAKFSSLASSLRGGHVDASAINSANGDISSLSQQSAQAGQAIKEQVPSTPSG